MDPQKGFAGTGNSNQGHESPASVVKLRGLSTAGNRPLLILPPIHLAYPLGGSLKVSAYLKFHIIDQGANKRGDLPREHATTTVAEDRLP